MKFSVSSTLKEITVLWRKNYLPLLPFTVLSVFCFNISSFLNNYALAALLTIPGFYCYNIILLRLKHFIYPDFSQEKIYAIALSRLPHVFALFLGLGALGITSILLSYALFGIVFTLIISLVLVVFYSYLIFSYPLIVLNNCSAISAVKKSFYFVYGDIWYITGIFLIVGLAQGLGYAICIAVFRFGVGNILYSFIFTTFNLILSVVVLEHLKKSS